MCAACKIILNQIDDVVSSGGSVHRGTRRGVEKVLDELPGGVQNKLSSIDAKHTRRRLAQDLEYFEEVVEVLSSHTGEKF